MTPKERVITALNHKEPDRVPRSASFTPEFADKLRKRLGLESILFNPHGGAEHDLELKLGNDLLLTGQGFANSYYKSLENNYTDEWGIEWKIVKYKTKLGEGRYTEINTHPLSSDNAINSYIPPSADVKNRYGPSKELIDTYGKEYPIVGVIVCTIFETAWALRGLDKLMMDFLVNEELANRILDIPFEYHLTAGKKLVELGVDIIWTGDDVGGQNNMLISPEVWRKYLKPRMSRLFTELKKINPELKIAYHSDGNIYPILDDLVEIGLDILNPVQPKSMDPYFLKEKYGEKISFFGTIDIQETLPFGTKKEIEDEVKNRIKIMAQNGGFIIAPTHHVQIDTSLENFYFFWNSVDKYGKYPINI